MTESMAKLPPQKRQRNVIWNCSESQLQYSRHYLGANASIQSNSHHIHRTTYQKELILRNMLDRRRPSQAFLGANRGLVEVGLHQQSHSIKRVRFSKQSHSLKRDRLSKAGRLLYRKFSFRSLSIFVVVAGRNLEG